MHHWFRRGFGPQIGLTTTGVLFEAMLERLAQTLSQTSGAIALRHVKVWAETLFILSMTQKTTTSKLRDVGLQARISHDSVCQRM